jgi:hypothetical protein
LSHEIEQLERFSGEHLTAAALMVKLAPPLDPSIRALAARQELEEKEFDLALVDDERLLTITRTQLRTLSRANLSRPVREFAQSPRRDRLIEASLPIRQVAAKLAEVNDPLLVVGNGGATHVVTLSDFGGVAGTAVVLSYVVAVDGLLNDLLHLHAERTWQSLRDDDRAAATRLHHQAEQDGGALELIDYRTMGMRLRALRRLGLHREHDLLDTEQHKVLLNVRNKSAHSSIGDQRQAIQAIEISEKLIGRLSEVLRGTPPP